VLAHGFTQTSRVWGTMDEDLASDHRLIAVDMPGHGRSSGVHASLPDGAALLGRAGGRSAYLGYSMGARFCLHLALARPDLVEALVLVSGTAGIDDVDERAERRRADEALAEQLDPVDRARSVAVPLDTFLRRWMEGPMFAGIGAEEGGLAERLTNNAAGLASSLRLAGTGTQLPLWLELPRLDMPVLVVTGELDAKFSELGERMGGAIGPNARHVIVPGAGHAPHLQFPVLVGDLVRRWLARTGDR
jgi:2-succinyl-6-hydroxy-2,4-cyclohexadiene-1-carboxylate synthase